jgi:XTP/dITP diphosphohydrolase
MKPTLLIATTNPAKLAEYRLLLRDYPLDLLSLDAVGIAESPAETGATFRENALLKARYYFSRSGLPTLADDGGLEVDALGGAPGVASHRWLGPDADDAALAQAVVERVNALEDPPRGARLRCALALLYRRGTELVEGVAEAAFEGVVAPRVYVPIRRGFPYRSVVYLPERGRYVAELGEEEEARISQRRIAIERAQHYLREIAASRPPAC